MTFLITFCILLVFSFSYLALTKPKQMPFIGHFFDKIVYGSLYYLNRPDESYIYTTNSNIDLKIHIFRPEKIETKSSLLLFHGGGWAFGSSYSLFKMCRDISDQGILCASAEYRLALKHNSKVKDSMLVRGDEYYTAVCNKTGCLAIYNETKNNSQKKRKQNNKWFKKN